MRIRWSVACGCCWLFVVGFRLRWCSGWFTAADADRRVAVSCLLDLRILSSIHPSACKVYSPNFAQRGFSEVRPASTVGGVLGDFLQKLAQPFHPPSVPLARHAHLPLFRALTTVGGHP